MFNKSPQVTFSFSSCHTRRLMGVSVPQPGTKAGPRQWKPGILTSRPLGNPPPGDLFFLIWTIFLNCYNITSVGCFGLLAESMSDLGSPAKDRTCTPMQEKAKSYAGPPGNSSPNDKVSR